MSCKHLYKCRLHVPFGLYVSNEVDVSSSRDSALPKINHNFWDYAFIHHSEVHRNVREVDFIFLQVLNSSVSEFESTTHAPGKWKMLAAFVLQCMDGPILDLFKKQLDQSDSERGALLSKRRSNEEKVVLLSKQLDENEKQKAEYLKHYEEVINKKQKISEDYSSQIANMQGKCSVLQERCSSLSKALDLAKCESSDWKVKYDDICLELKGEDEKYNTQITALESRISSAEGRLAVAREQSESAQEEALEWKRKYNTAVSEVKKALERAALAQEHTIKETREREDALREAFSKEVVEKDEAIKNLTAKIDHVESLRSSLVSQLKEADLKVQSKEQETLSLKDDIKKLMEKLEHVITQAQSHEKEASIMEQEKHHLQDQYLAICKKFEGVSERYKATESDLRRATELADIAREELAAAQNEKGEVHRLAMERLTIIERTMRRVEALEQENAKLISEVEVLQQSEMDAVSKIALLEGRVDERENEIEKLMGRNNEQRTSTVQVLESLLENERAARAEANKRAEALSLQLQATQGKLDALHQEMTSVRLNETALDSKLRTASHHGKRLRSCIGTESVQDMDIDGEKFVKGKKRSKSDISPLRYTEVSTESPEITENDFSEDYSKLTVQKLKQKLTENGYGGELLQLSTPGKKNVLALYEKLVLKR